jgi:hypothetical protein
MQCKPLLILLLLLGCGGDGGINPSPTIVLAKVSGDDQEGIVGQVLAHPIQVLVSENNAPVAGATVTWTNGLGDVFTPASTSTDADGLASTQWTLGPGHGVSHATATVTGSPVGVDFTATAIHDVPALIEKFGGDNQKGTVNTRLSPVQAYVTDQFGNFVAGLEVGWKASGAALASPTVTTNFTGVSSAQVTLGNTPGPVTITATVDGVTGSPLTFKATAEPILPPVEPLVSAIPQPADAATNVR